MRNGEVRFLKVQQQELNLWYLIFNQLLGINVLIKFQNQISKNKTDEAMGSNTVISYDTLKQAAFSTNISPFMLEELKNIFKVQIASTRRQDCIRSIADFIDVLERRDEISENNIDIFYKLANRYHLTCLRDALGYYCIPKYTNGSLRLRNEYRERRLADSLQENLHAPRNHPNSVVNSESFNGGTSRVPIASFVGFLSDEKRRVIYKKLCKELGRHWRNFGRKLNICEGDMDNIESQAQDLSTRILKLLKLFEEDECNDPKEHCLLLCRALDECERKDLRRDVEKIMSH